MKMTNDCIFDDDVVLERAKRLITQKLMDGSLVAENKVTHNPPLDFDTDIFEFNFVSFYYALKHNREPSIKKGSFRGYDLSKQGHTILKIAVVINDKPMLKTYFSSDYNVCNKPKYYNANALFTNVTDLIIHMNKCIKIIQEVM